MGLRQRIKRIYIYIFCHESLEIQNDLAIDRAFAITSSAWRLSRFNTLPALYILETKQIKNAWGFGTFLELGAVCCCYIEQMVGSTVSEEMQRSRGGPVLNFGLRQESFPPDAPISHLMNRVHSQVCQRVFQARQIWNLSLILMSNLNESARKNYLRSYGCYWSDGAFVFELRNSGRKQMPRFTSKKRNGLNQNMIKS